jgi:hypothetical protein
MPVNTTSGNARRSHRAAIDCPANAISAPHFSAKSSQRGFIDSIKTLLRPPLTLDLLFPIDRCENVVEAFPVNQAIAFEIGGKALDLAAFVLKRSHV